MRKIHVAAFVVFVAGSLFLPVASAQNMSASNPTDFQNALDTAAINGEDDTITVAAGVYDLSLGPLIASVTDNYALTIQGAGTGSTILDGMNLGPIMSISGLAPPTGSLTIRGITFRNGFGGDPGASALEAAWNGMTIQDCEFLDNKADLGGPDAGGGARLNGQGIILDNNLFRGNWGGDRCGGAQIVGKSITLNGNIFRNNRGGLTGAGGACIIQSYGTVTLTNNVFDNNLCSGVFGCPGGLYIRNSTVFGMWATLTNNTFINNRAFENTPHGGATIVLSKGLDTDGLLNVYNNIFWNNFHLDGNLTVIPTDLAVGADNAIAIYANRNLFSDTNSVLVAHDNYAVLPGSHLFGQNPRLTSDYHLEVFPVVSPAVDSGDIWAAGLPFEDFEGDGRVLGPGVDIGADESPGSPPVPTIGVTPSSIDFGTVTVGTSADRTVQVSNAGIATLNIGAVTFPASPFSIVSENCSFSALLISESCTITVRFSPTGTGAASGSFDIRSDDTGNDPFTVSLVGNGTAVDVPDIEVIDPSPPDNDLSVDFGTVNIHIYASRTITIANVGSADLVIGNIAVADPLAAPFSIGSDNCSGQTIPPSGTCDFEVGFQPSAQGSQIASFDIPSNDPDPSESPVTVHITGEGGQLFAGGVGRSPGCSCQIGPGQGISLDGIASLLPVVLCILWLWVRKKMV